MKLYMFIAVVVSLFGLLLCATEEDIAACKGHVFGVVRCASVNFYYRECPVSVATQLHAIKLNQKFSREPCEFKSSFGYRENAVWVTAGCSGEFYICYEGEPMSTLYPPVTVTLKTDGPSTPREVEVAQGSSSGTNDVLIYVIAASCVVLVVGIGLIIGCVVKRRQQKDKSRHLAEKRQIRIELKEHRDNMEENGVVNTMVPMATRSLSVESINYGDAVNYEHTERCDFEKEGSICSSRSSSSTIFSGLSARTTGHLVRARPSLRRMSSRLPSKRFGQLKKGLSTPDISSLGRMYCEASTSSRKQETNSLKRYSRSSLMRCSQSSLESVREVCNKYQVFDIPLENRLKQQARRSSQNCSVSFDNSAIKNNKSTLSLNRGSSLRLTNTGGSRASTPERLSVRSSMRSLPAGVRRTTKAMVHCRSPSPKVMSVSTSSNPKSEPGDRKLASTTQAILAETTNVEKRSTEKEVIPEHRADSQTFHYHDPTSLFQKTSSPPINPKPQPNALSVKKADVIYETIQRPNLQKPMLLPKPKIKPSPPIYATVNKSYFKAASRAEKGDVILNFKNDVISLEDDEDDVISMTSERENQYARLGKFKSASVFAIPVPSIKLPGVSTSATKI